MEMIFQQKKINNLAFVRSVVGFFIAVCNTEIYLIPGRMMQVWFPHELQLRNTAWVLQHQCVTCLDVEYLSYWPSPMPWSCCVVLMVSMHPMHSVAHCRGPSFFKSLTTSDSCQSWRQGFADCNSC